MPSCLCFSLDTPTANYIVFQSIFIDQSSCHLNYLNYFIIFYRFNFCKICHRSVLSGCPVSLNDHELIFPKSLQLLGRLSCLPSLKYSFNSTFFSLLPNSFFGFMKVIIILLISVLYNIHCSYFSLSLDLVISVFKISLLLFSFDINRLVLWFMVLFALVSSICLWILKI